jgi:hypothetical protein
MVIFGSYATEASEPGQILTEAALRNVFRVPWECLGGVNCLLFPGEVTIEGRVHGFLVARRRLLSSNEKFPCCHNTMR